MTRPYTPRQLVRILSSCHSGHELTGFQKAYIEVKAYLPLGTHLVIAVLYKSKLNKAL